MLLQVWDIVRMDVMFDDKNNIKERPVIVIDEKRSIYCSLKITSNTARKGLSEYKI